MCRPASDLTMDSTPIAVLDFETTGLSPRLGARIIEVAVVRIEPDGIITPVLNSLVDPEGPVHCTRIHGITDDDVLGAPRACDIEDHVLSACAGAVVAAYNATFDMGFWAAEFRCHPPPFLCFRYIRSIVNVGDPGSLEWACAEAGIPSGGHWALFDAIAAARLWPIYLEAAQERKLRTFGDLRPRNNYQFLRSLERAPLGPHPVPTAGTALKPRAAAEPALACALGTGGPSPTPAVTLEEARRRYWHAVVEALGDNTLEDAELAFLRELISTLDLDVGDVRAIHARYFGERLAAAAEDNEITGVEAADLHRLHQVLGRVGWAPGQSLKGQRPV